MKLEGEVGTRFYKQWDPVEIIKRVSDEITLGTVTTVKLVDRLQNHEGDYSSTMRDESLNQGAGRGNEEVDISKVKLTRLGIQFEITEWEKAESGDDSKISSGIALTGIGNRRGGKDLGLNIMSLFQSNLSVSHQYTSRKAQETSGHIKGGAQNQINLPLTASRNVFIL